VIYYSSFWFQHTAHSLQACISLWTVGSNLPLHKRCHYSISGKIGFGPKCSILLWWYLWPPALHPSHKLQKYGLHACYL